MTVTPAADPCVGNLATPVNSGYFIKALINNLPFYRAGISPNFRGLETGAAFGYLLYGPYTICGPLRNTEFSATAGLLAAIGAVHILTLLFLLYNQPADLFTRTGWADFTSGFWLGGCGGAVFAWFLCGTLHVSTLLKLAGGVWSVG